MPGKGLWKSKEMMPCGGGFRNVGWCLAELWVWTENTWLAGPPPSDCLSPGERGGLGILHRFTSAHPPNPPTPPHPHPQTLTYLPYRLFHIWIHSNRTTPSACLVVFPQKNCVRHNIFHTLPPTPIHPTQANPLPDWQQTFIIRCCVTSLTSGLKNMVTCVYTEHLKPTKQWKLTKNT